MLTSTNGPLIAKKTRIVLLYTNFWVIINLSWTPFNCYVYYNHLVRSYIYIHIHTHTYTPCFSWFSCSFCVSVEVMMLKFCSWSEFLFHFFWCVEEMDFFKHGFFIWFTLNCNANELVAQTTIDIYSNITVVCGALLNGCSNNKHSGRFSDVFISCIHAFSCYYIIQKFCK